MSQDLLASLNSKQYEAVTAPETSLLILAGAGSGKTRVLTTRIAWLLQNNKARPGEILAVTFTNKAAKEMMTRLEGMLPYDLHNMWVGTFHGLCNRILRRHALEAGLPKTFQIMDNADQAAMVKRVMKGLNIDTDRVEPRQVQNFINWHKENGIRANRAGTGLEQADEGVKIYQAYEAQCQKEGAVDFAELLLRCYELLDRNEVIRTHYQERFRHILVDEFQDTNVLQYRWLQMLAGLGQGEEGRARNSVFAVGDDDQSIYAFRGANVGNMSDFLHDFKTGEPIRLEENYRSTGAILDAANALISHNPDRLGKNLWTSGAHGDAITVVEHEDDREEANWIAREIEADRQRQHRYRDHAILYRVNAQSRAIESALTARGIPYRVYGGQRFFERMEVKHVLAYLRLLEGSGDDTSFLRVVNFPTRGIGAKTIEKLSDDAAHTGMSLWATLTHPAYEPPAKLAAFRDLILRIRDEADQMNLMDVIQLVIVKSGLKAYYQADRDGQDRLENMGEMLSAARGYMENEGIAETVSAFHVVDNTDQSPLQGFLTQATLEAGDKNEGDDQDVVQVMTVHAAKGLEFKNVYIIGVEDGLFPHFSAMNMSTGGAGVEEERRLMYVAITRAQKRLTISYCQTRLLHGEYRNNAPSSFLAEIPESLIHRQGERRRRDDDDDGYTRERFDENYGWERPSFGGSSRNGLRGYASGRSSYSKPSRSSSTRRSHDEDWRRGMAQEGKTYRASEETIVRRAQAQQAQDSYGFQVGDRIEHKKFGPGKVMALIGSGNDMRIRIAFDRVGSKELMLTLAVKNLTKQP